MYVIYIVVEVKAFGIHSLYPDFRVFDSVFGQYSIRLPLTIGKKKSKVKMYIHFKSLTQALLNSLPLLFLIYSLTSIQIKFCLRCVVGVVVGGVGGGGGYRGGL